MPAMSELLPIQFRSTAFRSGRQATLRKSFPKLQESRGSLLSQFCPAFPLGLPHALKGCVNALSFGYRVAQFATISPKCMPNPYELRFASLKVSAVVFLSGV
jgi:hypothetical protein